MGSYDRKKTLEKAIGKIADGAGILRNYPEISFFVKSWIVLQAESLLLLEGR